MIQNIIALKEKNLSLSWGRMGKSRESQLEVTEERDDANDDGDDSDASEEEDKVEFNEDCNGLEE